MKRILVAVSAVMFLAWFGAHFVNEINLNRNCRGYLKRAADANTVELAKKNLAVAIQYLEENKLTSGYTSVLWRTPDEDIGFWYDNLKSALEELRKVLPEATQLERTNVLMKLRETLLDQGERGTYVTVPFGMSTFPNNAVYAMWGTLSIILGGIAVSLVVMENL